MCRRCYRLYRVLPTKEACWLRPNCDCGARLAVLGDLGADAARNLREMPWPVLELASENWRTRTLCTIIDIWLLLIRKRGWDDRDAVLKRISMLRQAQGTFEATYLNDAEGSGAKAAALELMALYHLAKAAESLPSISPN